MSDVIKIRKNILNMMHNNCTLFSHKYSSLSVWVFSYYLSSILTIANECQNIYLIKLMSGVFISSEALGILKYCLYR